uniref:uncharacterized protein LOC120341396 n=1 Tax=Styela clava TaxID=7725 RepID=UPI0019399905|nr:uncharacterized protein LOC120341396 [Styela clava]
MFSSTFIWLVCLGGAFAVDISMNIQLGSESVSESCDEQATITASSEEELRDKLTKKLESVLLKNPDAEITISTQINVNGQIHSTKITNTDITSTTDDAVDTSKENVATTVALPTTGDVIDYTMDDVMTEFDTRSVTSIAPSTFESTTLLKDQSTETEMITEEQEGADFVTADSTTAETTIKVATNKPRFREFTCNSKYYYIIVRGKLDVSIDNAKSYCGSNHLADIYDIADYNLLTDCLRSKISIGWKWAVSVWTGLTYKNNLFLSSSGKPVDLSTKMWYPKYPSSNARYTNVALHVNKDPESHKQGIFNDLSSTKLKGVICEK